MKLAQFDYEERTIDGSIELFQKYELYVDTILNASEEILHVSPTKEWDVAVRIQFTRIATICCRLTSRNPDTLNNTVQVPGVPARRAKRSSLNAAVAAERRQD